MIPYEWLLFLVLPPFTAYNKYANRVAYVNVRVKLSGSGSADYNITMIIFTSL